VLTSELALVSQFGSVLPLHLKLMEVGRPSGNAGAQHDAALEGVD